MVEKIKIKPFLILLGIIVAINFIYAITYKIKPKVDAKAYYEIASNLVTLKEYRSDPNTPLNLDESIARIGPGYEFFVAGHLFFFGDKIWIIWLTQALLYASTIGMLAVISVRLFPQLMKRFKLLLFVLFFFGVLLDMVQLNAMLMTESLFLFFLVLNFFIWSQIETHKYRSLYPWILLGLTLGTLTLIRPTGLIVFILITFFSIYKNRKMIPPLLITTFFFILVQIPWIIRNYNVFNEFVFHSTAGGLNILSGNYPGNHGEFKPSFPLYQELKTRFPKPTDFNTESKRWYRNFVLDNPIEAMKIKLEKTAILFSIAKTSGFWFHYLGRIDQLATILISAFQNTVILGTYVFFIILLLNKGVLKITKKEILILITSFSLLITPILTVIANRHRLPFLILCLPISAFVIFTLREDGFKKHYKKIIISLIILFISTSIDILLQFDKFKDRITNISQISIEIPIKHV